MELGRTFDFILMPFDGGRQPMRCLFRFADGHNGSAVPQWNWVDRLILFGRRSMAADNRCVASFILWKATMAPPFPIEYGGTFILFWCRLIAAGKRCVASLVSRTATMAPLFPNGIGWNVCFYF